MKLSGAIFTSPEKRLHVVKQRDIQESLDDGTRMLPDKDGNARVTLHCRAVREDFARHVITFKRG